MKGYVILPVAILLSLSAQAGKIETVKETVKVVCGKDYDDAQALKMIKKAYLNCVAGQDVDTDDGCKIKCLKENTGSVVGG